MFFVLLVPKLKELENHLISKKNYSKRLTKKNPGIYCFEKKFAFFIRILTPNKFGNLHLWNGSIAYSIVVSDLELKHFYKKRDFRRHLHIILENSKQKNNIFIHLEFEMKNCLILFSLKNDLFPESMEMFSGNQKICEKIFQELLNKVKIVLLRL